jgi:hypothetical protein
MNLNRILLLLAGVFFALVWLNRQLTLAKPAAATAAKKTPLAQSAAPVASVNTARSEEPQARHYRPRQVSEAVRRKVESFIRRYKDVPLNEVTRSEELDSIKQLVTQVLDSPEFQSEMEKRMETIKATRGQEHGTLNIGFGKLGDPESRAMLEAVFSEDVELIQQYFLNKLDGAIFEFAFDPTLENAGNGVTVQGAAPPPAPAADKLPD